MRIHSVLLIFVVLTAGGLRAHGQSGDRQNSRAYLCETPTALLTLGLNETNGSYRVTLQYASYRGAGVFLQLQGDGEVRRQRQSTSLNGVVAFGDSYAHVSILKDVRSPDLVTNLNFPGRRNFEEIFRCRPWR